MEEVLNQVRNALVSAMDPKDYSHSLQELEAWACLCQALMHLDKAIAYMKGTRWSWCGSPMHTKSGECCDETCEAHRLFRR